MCVCVCVCAHKITVLEVCLITTPKVCIQKEKLPVSVSVSISLTHRRKRAVCACGCKQKKSELSQLPASRKKGCSFSTKEKNTPNTHTYRNVTLLYVCIIWKMNRQTNKQTFCFSAHRKLCVLVSRQKKKKVSISTLKSHFLKITGQKCILPHKDRSR